MTKNHVALLAVVALGLTLVSANAAGPQASNSVRLYVFDGGTLGADSARFNLKPEEVVATDFSVASYLVVHPKGTLLWDAGAVPDAQVTTPGVPTKYHLILRNTERYVTLTRSLRAQLADTGHRPADVSYLALSHYHYDHTANANDFAGATWLVRAAERAAMFADAPPDLVERRTFSALQIAKTTVIDTDDYDVFGDGSVVIKWAPGHTPGHQMLFVKLERTGPVLLSGDLYHYPEERRLDRLPTFEFDSRQTRQTRKAIEVFLTNSGAQLWIQHDLKANTALKKAPNFYE
jgi:glyoxylase-like metal-dependent hydrolase (beta-lactamase superfamily II)